MTRQETRQDLADAASSVDGIRCSPNFVQTTTAGEAMVRFDHTDYPNKFGGLVTWQVAVVLPQDFADAEKFVDNTMPALAEALGTQMVVTRVSQAQLVLDNGTLPIAIVEGTREEE